MSTQTAPQHQQKPRGPSGFPKFRKDLPTEPTMVELLTNEYYGKTHPDPHNPWKAGHKYVGLCKDDHRHRGGKIIFFRPGAFEHCIKQLRPGHYLACQLVKEFLKIGEACRYEHAYQVRGLGRAAVFWQKGYLPQDFYNVPDVNIAYKTLQRLLHQTESALQTSGEQAYRNEQLELARQEADEAEAAEKARYGFQFDQRELDIVAAVVDASLVITPLEPRRERDEKAFNAARKDGLPLTEEDVQNLWIFTGRIDKKRFYREGNTFYLSPISNALGASDTTITPNGGGATEEQWASLFHKMIIIETPITPNGGGATEEQWASQEASQETTAPAGPA